MSGKKRKNQPGYIKATNSLGHDYWKPQASPAHSDSSTNPTSAESDFSSSSTPTLEDYTKEDILDYFNDNSISQEEKDDPSNDDLRTRLYQLSQSELESISDDQVVSQLQQPDGGLTADIINKKSITQGFAYSPYPERSVAVQIEDLTADDIESFVDSNRDLLEKKGNYLGAWHDPETGTVFLDISVTTDDASEARRGCIEGDQIAFFDMQTLNSVTVDRDATSGGATG